MTDAVRGLVAAFTCHAKQRQRRLAAFALLTLCILAGAESAAQVPEAAPKTVAARADPRLDSLRESVRTGQGPSPETVAILQRILADDPRQAEAHVLLGILYMRAGTLDLGAEAIAEFRQALALDPENVAARFHLGRAYLESGQTRRANEELQAAVARAPGRADLLTWLGESERALGHADRAVALGRKALQVDPASPEARYHLGRALLDLERPDEAIAEFGHALRAGAESSDLLEQLGAAYLDAMRPADALPVLLRTASLNPIHPTPRLLLARAYRMGGDLAKAEEQLGFAWRMIDNFGAQVTRGDMQPPAGPAAAFVQRIEVDALVERGLLLGARGETDAALGNLTQALKLAGDDGRIHRHLAKVAQDAGRLAVARTHADAAAKLGHPLPPESRAALDGASGSTP